MINKHWRKELSILSPSRSERGFSDAVGWPFACFNLKGSATPHKENGNGGSSANFHGLDNVPPECSSPRRGCSDRAEKSLFHETTTEAGEYPVGAPETIDAPETI